MRFSPLSTGGVRTLLLAFAIIAFLLQCWYFAPYTMDDAFISFRYATNLAHGYGFAWDAGGKPVEGFTNFLWVVLLAPAAWLGFDLVIVAKALSMLAGIAMILLLNSISEALVEKPTWQTALPSLVVGLAPFTAFHAMEGLETLLFGLLVVVMTWSFVGLIHERPRGMIGFCIAAFLAGLTRPEGIIIACSFFIVLLLSKRRRVLFSTRAIAVLTVTSLLGAGYFLWRWMYFGFLFPNPFYIKHASAFIHPNGVAYVASFLGIYASIPIVSLIHQRMRGYRIGSRFILLAPVVVMLCFYLGVDPIMGTAHRYLFSIYPLLLLSLPFGSNEQPSSRGAIWAAAYIVGAVAIVFLTTIRPLQTEAREYSRGMTAAHIKIGLMLRQVYTHHESRLLVCGDAGAIPYYSGFRTIDVIGLNNPELVHSGFSPERIFRQRPDVLVLYSKNGYDVSPDLGNGNDGRLAVSEAMNEYERVGARAFNRNYFLIVFARRGTSEATRLADAFSR